jgi:anti-sigma factor RsiW
MGGVRPTWFRARRESASREGKGRVRVDEGNRTAEALTCRELVELVTDYLEGALAEGERARFDEHVAGCGPCTIYLAQMRRTLTLVGRLTEGSVSAEAREALLGAFRDWRR